MSRTLAPHDATTAEGLARPGRPLPCALGVALAAVAAATGALTFAVDGVVSGPAVMQGSARGTALVMAALAVPTLLLGLWLARRGDARGVLLWLGATAYLLYNAVLLLFATPFNALFPLSVATLSLSIAGVVALLRATDVARAAEPFARVPARGIAAYLWFVAGANALGWLRVVLPALGEESPAFLEGTGLTTNPIYVQDLAFWLPLAMLVAWWLWQRRPEGLVLGGAYLVFWFVEGVGVAVDQWLGSAADPASDVATMGGAYLFLGLALVTLVPLVAFLRPTGRSAR